MIGDEDHNQKKNKQINFIIQTKRTALTKKINAIIEPSIRPIINVISDHRIAFL